MPYFYTLFCILFLLTLFAFLLTRRSLRLEETRTDTRQSLGYAARIAAAAANDVFGSSLDYSDESVQRIDAMIDINWKMANSGDWNESTAEPSNNRLLSSQGNTRISDGIFILAAYLGETLVRAHSAVWQIDETRHPYPYVLIQNQFPASPFDLLLAKISDPQSFDLAASYKQLLESLSVPDANSNV